jgi:hypothetical protein
MRDCRVGNGFAVAHADGGHAPTLRFNPVDETLDAFMLGAMDAAEDGVAMPQCGQTGASAAMAHSNESNTRVRLPMVTSKL